MTRSYYRGASAVVVVYDITKRESFEHVDMWIQLARERGNENIPIFLFGNKFDLEDKRKVR